MHNDTLSIDLAELQSGQQRHDEFAHRDVLALSAARRVTHFTLHFAKYAGALLKAQRTGNQESTTRVLTDSLIIALACSNTVGIELPHALGQDRELLDER